MSLFSNSFDSRISTGPSFHNVKIYPSKYFSSILLNFFRFVLLLCPRWLVFALRIHLFSTPFFTFLLILLLSILILFRIKALSVLSGSIILKVKDADCITAAQNSFSSLSSSDFSITNSSSITPSLVRLTLSNS